MEEESAESIGPILLCHGIQSFSAHCQRPACAELLDTHAFCIDENLHTLPYIHTHMFTPPPFRSRY